VKRVLTDLQLEPEGIAGDERRVGISFGRQFEGDGEYERTDEVITRLTARVVDVKPNGTLALEARTHLANDDETVTITVTGYCRAEDVTADNSVLSTQMYDLRVAKKHTGEIRDASKKGLFTKGLDYLFNF
jgi:flagellar L-ring protein precursor FlgH